MSAPRRTTRSATKRARVKLIEIEITGGGPLVPQLLSHCVALGAQGKTATLRALGARATVKVTK